MSARRKVKIGDYIKAFRRSRPGQYWRGVVTEVFEDLIQVYGDGDNEGLDFYEFEPAEYRITYIDKKYLKFIFELNTSDLLTDKIELGRKVVLNDERIRKANEMFDKYFTKGNP